TLPGGEGMSTSTFDRYSNSSLKSEVFTTSAISQLFRQRSTATDSSIHTPLSVGQKGVTPQLDNVAKSQQTGGRKLVKKGDIVINSRSDRRGASGLSDRDGSVSLIYIVLKPNLEKINPEFAHHLIRSKGFQEEFYRFGTGIVADLWSTRYERMAQIRVPLPPMETQQRIADYLDRETAEIDAAVADLDRYVELLEKRKKTLAVKHIFPYGFPQNLLSASDYLALGYQSVQRIASFAKLRKKRNDDPNADYLSLLRGRGVIPYEEKGNVGNKKPQDLTTTFMVEKGDYLVNSMNFGIGSFGRSSYSGVAS